jgi:hypothetical protein
MNGQTFDKKTSAHQLWVDGINETVAKIMKPASLQKKAYGFMTSKLQLENTLKRVLDAITEHENTRLRVVVDLIIAKLNGTTSALDEVKAEHAATHRLNLFKKKRLRDLAREITVRQSVIQDILLVVVNTRPPAPEAKVVNLSEMLKD